MAMNFYNDEWETFIANCGFTDDELEVVPLLRRGWAQIDIAVELCISLSTLKRRKKRISQKIIRYISKAS
jgi:DNA-binding NarL/FixJ family response regulator